eukprot:gnl/Hemi2/2652_TR940_c0_g1_i1.p1 gnl/Hemi2/2652_TR940_c0_g1~~gnl/Hemi2/2652_TR940_c0_g1_i1.p1  ORF type:complete len:463 (+),score=87.93 gnl/Hemi2/2652_TR940_c0_g1_i1:84-1472(+)
MELLERATSRLVTRSRLKYVGLIVTFVVFFCVIFFLLEDSSPGLPIQGERVPKRLCPHKFTPRNSSALISLLVSHAKYHHRILELPKAERKFVIFEYNPAWTFTTQIQGLMSAYLLAVLTNRAFVVNWELIHQLFDLPLLGLDWRYTEFLSDHRNYQTDKANFRSLVVAQTTAWVDFSASELLLCGGNLALTFADSQYLVVQSNQYFVPLLFHNPEYTTNLCEAFSGSDIFQPTFKMLFNPKPALLKEIDSFVQQHFYRTGENGERVRLQTIGLQIPKQTQSFFEQRINQEAFYFRCAEFLTRATDDVVWVLATDSPEIRKQAHDMYPTRVVSFGFQEPTPPLPSPPPPAAPPLSVMEEEGVAEGSAPREENKLSRSDATREFIEAWLIGECDDVITSNTFGYFAHSRTSIVPHIVTSGLQCYQQLSSQPCFQHWFKLSGLTCWAQTKRTVDMINLDNCEDG